MKERKVRILYETSNERRISFSEYLGRIAAIVLRTPVYHIVFICGKAKEDNRGE